LSEAEGEYSKLALELSTRRRKAAEALGQRVMKDLKYVAMEQAHFNITVRTAKPPQSGIEQASDNVRDDNDEFFTQSGADRVEFFLSANPGEEPRSLSRVASGGELSRLMLTLRTISLNQGAGAATAEGATVIFDEIDVGIGGRVAEAVGRRLKSLAAARQVLCVTHQPQIARFADHHFVVSKGVENGRTVTAVRELETDERVEELARMIGGGEEGAQTTIEAARWLLESANDINVSSTDRRTRKSRQKILTQK
jgi:DNA repair protein RecN (Recombination protein N)